VCVWGGGRGGGEVGRGAGGGQEDQGLGLRTGPAQCYCKGNVEQVCILGAEGRDKQGV
jgi:hypothetical protein